MARSDPPRTDPLVPRGLLFLLAALIVLILGVVYLAEATSHPRTLPWMTGPEAYKDQIGMTFMVCPKQEQGVLRLSLRHATGYWMLWMTPHAWIMGFYGPLRGDPEKPLQALYFGRWKGDTEFLLVRIDTGPWTTAEEDCAWLFPQTSGVPRP